MAESNAIKLLSEKTLHHRVQPELVAYCPSMDLIAIGSLDQQVLVYRLNGQRVYGAAQKGSILKVNKIQWKPNGQLLALGWSDGVVRLVGAESNKTVHQISTTGDKSVEITCLGWASNSTVQRRSRSAVNVDDSWKQLISVAGADVALEDTPLDLPRDLTLLDIESSMPKLSVLPAGGTSEDVFCSRASLDALFRPFDPKDNDTVDVMVIGTQDGQVHLSIYDSFIIGSFQLPLFSKGSCSLASQLLLHASHRTTSTHSLVMRSKVGTNDMLNYVSMDLRFVAASDGHLSLLASKSTQLQNLLRYVLQVQVLTKDEWKSTQDLPQKFLRNINDTLNERHGCDIVQAMYHSVTTGHTYPAMKEWLVDELTDRGLKRWDKAVISGYENIRRLIHENMIPALERCCVILSRLGGLAKYQGTNDTTGLSTQYINRVLDTISALNLVVSRILTYVVEELDLFAAFSIWLRREYDKQTSEGSSNTTDDSIEKESMIDHGKVLLYIQTSLTNSRLSPFFHESSAADLEKNWGSMGDGISVFELIDTQLRKHDDYQAYTKALLPIDSLCHCLTKQASAMFQQVAEAEKRNVFFGQSVQLGNEQAGAPLAMKMCAEESTRGFVTYIATGLADQKNQLRIFRIRSSFTNGLSATMSSSVFILELGGGIIKDICFADEQCIIILWFSNGTSHLLWIPFQQQQYSSFTQNTLRTLQPKTYHTEQILSIFGSFPFPSEGGFVPMKLEIDGEKSVSKVAEAGGRRLCVLGEDRLHYKVYAMLD